MFDAYKRDPTTDNLIALLRATQDRVYRLCFHVLRRPHDAEDAAQEVLIRIVEGVRGIDDAGQFHRWVYRVSLNAALESIRKSARRQAHESRAAMTVPPEPLDEESRLALFEGIAGLDDASRTLILDHYFEGRTLESIASRDGVSPQAASKRLEKAREHLKRALPVGLLALPDLGGLFPRGGPPSAAPDLVSGAVLAKVHSIAALAAGGTVMASKSSIAAVVAFSLIACLGAGTGAVLLLRSTPGPKPEIPVPAKVEQKTPGTFSIQTGSPNVANDDADRRAVAAAKRRIMEAFAKHYSKLNSFAAVKKDKFAGMYLRTLVENKDLKALAASLAEDESGHSLTALRELYESSKTELRHFSLLLLAQGGRS
ncbi:MAG TPA: sigma-70 family RNA polymerase sigma factor, partial [Planctomycetota bacterium]|nr:sigma-70 family RNA polymerase sigma factor [Planctomycetota bacterium]